AIIEELLQVAEGVTITLVASKIAIHEQLDELDLFHQTKETYATLQELAREARIRQAETVFLNEITKKKQPFIHLQQCFDDRPNPAYPEAIDEAVMLAEAVHPRAELEGVIQEILYLVREKKYRYRDIALFVRETDQYYDLIQTLFRD